jgi:hypothetical protein
VECTVCLCKREGHTFFRFVGLSPASEAALSCKETSCDAICCRMRWLRMPAAVCNFFKEKMFGRLADEMA